jgi:hypothetical protein
VSPATNIGSDIECTDIKCTDIECTDIECTDIECNLRGKSFIHVMKMEAL